MSAGLTRVATPDFASVTEVATLLAVTPETVRDWIRAGRLQAARTPGGGWRVPLSAVSAALEPIEPGG